MLSQAIRLDFPHRLNGTKMSRQNVRIEIREVLQQKEILLYEAKQSPMAYFVPCFTILLGIVLCFPQVWDFLQSILSEKTVQYIPIAKHVFSDMLFGLVFAVLGIGVMFSRHRQSRTNFHFVTNMRVVERSKTFAHDDMQYVMLHHLKFVRVKSGIIDKLTGTGTLIFEDDKALEHVEVPRVSNPKGFKKAILTAQSRFYDTAARAESDGMMMQVQSKKSLKEKRKKEKEAARKKKREAEEVRKKKKREEEELLRVQQEEELKKKEQNGYY